jgi:hypothetical protein
MHWVKQAQYLEDYKLLLTFNDKKKKVVDFKKMLRGFKGEVFRPLKDLQYFKKFKLDLNTIVWPNEADVCPDVLYMEGELVKEENKKYIKQYPNKTKKK